MVEITGKMTVIIGMMTIVITTVIIGTMIIAMVMGAAAEITLVTGMTAVMTLLETTADGLADTGIPEAVTVEMILVNMVVDGHPVENIHRRVGIKIIITIGALRINRTVNKTKRRCQATFKC
jgi:hypothetical protein